MPVTQPLSDRELLERFREGHADLGSVHDIARVSEAEFVSTYSPELANGQREARRIHQMARCVSETTALVWANLRDIAIPHLRTTLFNNVAQSFIEHSAAIPGYQALFGDLSVLECDDSRSVFGPAAYFVDLMRFVEQHVDLEKVRSVHALPYRRPDLAQLQLDAHNTYGLVPEIELVIDALSSLAASTGGTADDALRDARYPWVLPFDEPWERLRTDLSSLGVSFGEVSALFGLGGGDGDGDGDPVRVREALGLSAAEYDLLVAPPASPRLIAGSFGGADIAELRAVDVFLDRTGLSRAELSDLLSGAFDDAEVAAGLARLRFINDADDGLGHLDVDVDMADPQHPVETLVDLSPAKLDRIERFVRLSRRLDWSFSDLDLALSSSRGAHTAEDVLSFDGINDYAVVAEADGLPRDAMTIECWVRPSEHRVNPVFAKGAEGANRVATDLLMWIDQDGRLAVQAGTGVGYSRSRRVIPVGTFSHVAVSVSGGSNPAVGLVIDGEAEPVWRVEANQESLDSALHGAIGESGSRLLFGRSFGGDVFSGAITDVRVWEGVRAPETIAGQRFTRLSGSERGLVGYWPLVRERWERLSDRSARANHAVIGGPGFVTRPRWVAHDLVLDALPPQVPSLFAFDGREDHLAATEVGTIAGEAFTIELLVQQRTAQPAPLIRWKNDAGVALGLGIDDSGRLRLEGDSVVVTSDTALAPDVLTHVAVAVASTEVTFVIDGVAEATHANPGIRMSDGPLRMWVGHDGASAYFAGHIGELRLWDRARTAAEIDMARHRSAPSSAPGLVGSWAMNGDDGARVLDRSFNAHHLWLGGDPATYRPQPVSAGPILPTAPIANEAALLRFDGANDFVTVPGHEAALGRLDRLTLGLWFQAADPAGSEPQMLFTQGDAEAGLSAYIASGAMHVVVWDGDFGQNTAAEYAVSSEQIDDAWHHLAVTVREGPQPADPACGALDQTEIVVYLDGAEINRHTTTTRLQLSPVGPTYLGGLGHEATSRVIGAFVTSDGPAQSFFSGLLADLQIWGRVLTAEELFRNRVAAPDPESDDLVVYLPMDDGSGHALRDPRPGSGVEGVLSRDDIALSATSVAVEAGNAFVHATVAGALEWANYDVTGRLRLNDAAALAGVTFLSRHPNGRDQCYALIVDRPGGAFRLTSRPHDLEALQGDLDTGIVPEVDSWYRFAIRVADTGNATTIEARVWADGDQEPSEASARAQDAGSYRLTAGTVGLWRRGSGGFEVSDMAVVPRTPVDAAPWIEESFEDAWPSDPGTIPDGWDATHVVPATVDTDDLFTIHDRDGALTFGTSADRPIDEQLSTRYVADGADEWSDYAFTGRFWLGDANAALGFTILAADATAAYRVRCLPHRPTLQLDTRAHDHSLEGTVDSGYDPAPGVWHRFFIEVEDAETHTSIRARFWPDGESEPDDFSIDASDASGDRLTQGTVGLWTVGEGERLVDDLLVFPRSLSVPDGESPRFAEDFESYTEGEHPADWSDTGPNNDDEPTELFAVSEDHGSKVLRSTTTARNAHSHYTGPNTLVWSNYVFTGRLLVRAENTGLGVTIFSRYPEIWFEEGRDPRAWRKGWMQRPHDRYYRLGRSPKSATFRLSAHPNRNETSGRSGERDHDRWPLQLDGTTDSGVNCELGNWYRFRIQVEDTGTETRVRAKLWLDGEPEPEAYQIDAVDAGEYRLTSGGIGLHVSGRGTRMVDDLAVRPIALLAETFDRFEAGFVPDGWIGELTGGQHEAAPSLFATHNTLSNAAMWEAADDAPVVAHPVGAHPLRFDGDHRFAGNPVRRLDLPALTMEAWVRPGDLTRSNPVVTLGSGATAVALGLDPGGAPALHGAFELVGDESVGSGWSHVAATIGDGKVALVVDGRQVAEVAVSVPKRMRRSAVMIGRAGSDETVDIFDGDIAEVRLWDEARSAAAIASTRYHGWATPPSSLVAWWIASAGTGDVLSDASGNGRELRMGGPSGSRHPDAAAPLWEFADASTLAPTHVVRFAGPDQAIVHAGRADSHSGAERTIEVWFRVEDIAIDRRKQLLYSEGDATQGLALYLHDGRLYVGGWSDPAELPVGEEPWTGSWLSTDQIASGRWHHAALVLDGRSEVRPGSLQAFVDGRLAAAAPGSRLRSHVSTFALGGAIADVRFHDGIAEGADHWLDGELMDVRLWTDARTPADVAAVWANEPDPDADHLDLWWQFNDGIVERTGRASTPDIDISDRTTPNAPQRPVHRRPIEVDPSVLAQLAAVKALVDRTGLALDRLVSLSGPIPHTGRRRGATLFDKLFNQEHSPPWDHADVPAVRWDVTSREVPDRDQGVRSRLMAGLRLSSEALDAAVAHVFGQELVIDLDAEALDRLYRAVAVARVLRVGHADLATLLAATGRNTIDGPHDLHALLDRIDWLETQGISMGDFLAVVRGDVADRGPSEPAVVEMLAALRSRAADVRLMALSFVAEAGSELESARWYETLTAADSGLVDRGVVTARIADPAARDAVFSELGLDDAEAAAFAETLHAHRRATIDAVTVSLGELFDVAPALVESAFGHIPDTVDPVAELAIAATVEAATEEAQARAADVVAGFTPTFALADLFDLRPADLTALLADTTTFGVSGVVSPSVADLDRLGRFRALRDAHAGHLPVAGLLTGSFPSNGEIASVMGSSELDVALLTEAFGIDSATPDRLSALERVHSALSLSNRLGVEPGLLIRLGRAISDGPDREIADAFTAVLRAHGDEAWERAKPERDELKVRTRDALLGVATRNVKEFSNARDAGDLLSEYLLMDVKVGTEVLTSRLVASLAAVQLYVQRCLLNLEEGVTLSAEAAQQWEWMKNYRVWEANRKVFLYPESYIEPELRDTKTPQFRELEQALMQAEINQEAVNTALSSYLSSFVEIADLKVVGSYRHKAADGTEDELLYLIGRTRAQPWRFFVRTLRNERTWEPWKPISLTIDSEFVSPVHAFGRLFVFWSEFAKLTESVDRVVPFWIRVRDKKFEFYPVVETGGATQQEYDDVIEGRRKLVPMPNSPYQAYLYGGITDERVQVTVDYYRPEVKFAFREFDGTWSAPQSIDDVAEKLAEVDHLQPEWQRVAVQRSLELEASPTTAPAVEYLTPDVLRVSAPTALSRASTVADTSDVTLSCHVRIDHALQSADLLGGVTEEDLKRRSLRLYSYVEKDGLTVQVRNRFQRIPGIPHVPDLAQIHEQSEEAAAGAQRLVRERTEAWRSAPDDAKEAAIELVREAEASLTAARSAETEAKEALDAALKTRQWEATIEAAVRFGATELVAPLPDGGWHHLATVIRHSGSGYDAELLIDGVAIATGHLVGPIMPIRDLIVVGENDGSSEDAFIASLSELRAWDVARSHQTIAAERDERMTGRELGLFHLPLDAALPGAEMTMVSETGLQLRKVRPPIAEIQRSKERIIMFCGDTRRLIENNLGDGGIDLRLDKSVADRSSYDLDLSAVAVGPSWREGGTWNRKRALSLHVITTRGVSLNDYVSGASSTLNRFTPQGLQRILEILPYLPPHVRSFFAQRVRAAYRSPDPTNRVLDELRPAEASLIDVGNQPGWYVLDTGDESYLLRASNPSTDVPLDLRTATERLRFRYDSTKSVAERQPVALSFDDDPALLAGGAAVPSFAFTRLTSRAPYELQRRLFASGVADVLGPHAQASPEKPLTAYSPVPDKIASRPPDVIDFDGAHGIYYWELFFHIPFLIADTLNAEQDYAAAQRWYHFIFDPTAATMDPRDHWRFIPFRDDPIPRLGDVLAPDSPALAAYRDDPFDPHAIAGLRASAYPKAILIKYIENLLDWADSLFSRDTGESVREALQLYLLAFNLLGPRPVERGNGRQGGVGDYETIKEAFENDPAPRRFARDVRSDIRALADDDGLPDFLTDYVYEPQNPDIGVGIALIDNGSILTTFCVPENSELIGLWDRVEDRLHKIRHSLNIEGIARTLALFEPPLDVSALVRAVAGGAGVGGAVSAGSVAVPHYRYGTMLGVAKELADTVTGLGSALASALASRDGAQLAALVNGHERELLGMVTLVKDAEIQAAREALDSLEISKRSMEVRKDRYAALVEEGLSPEEVAELILEGQAGVVRGATGLLKALEGVLEGVPEITAGGSGFGGSPVATATSAAATYKAGTTAAIGVADVIADVLDLTAGLVAKRGGWRRRAAEWDHELAVATLDLEESERQIAVAQIEVENAQRALAIHRREIEHNQEIAEFHRRKFSNQELYNWMVGRLSGLHFQAYRLAHGAAKAAERALQYELPTNETFISFGNWDGLRRGLLSGESLMLDLQRMEAHHLSQDSRFLEVEKTVRLSDLAPGQLALFKDRGACSFDLPELMFDRDHPGHYFRVIKTMEISIELPVAADETISATLVQLGTKALLDPSIDAVRYLLGDVSAPQPGDDVLRVDWRANQQIAISRADRDDGLFVLDFFRDDRYFPFEGTGAVSSWELEMDPGANPGIDFSRIEDVVIHLRYTAKADRGKFREAVKREVKRLTDP